MKGLLCLPHSVCVFGHARVRLDNASLIYACGRSSTFLLRGSFVQQTARSWDSALNKMSKVPAFRKFTLSERRKKIEEPCRTVRGFIGGSAVKNPPAIAGDAGNAGSIPGLGRWPGEGNGNPLQGVVAWWAIIHAAAKSRTWLSD